MTATTPYADLILPFLIAGTGLGFFFAPITRLTLSYAPGQFEGIASGTSNALRQVGTVLGIAVLGSVFSAAGGLGSPGQFTTGLRAALTVSAVILAASALVVLLAPETRPARQAPTASAPATVTAASSATPWAMRSAKSSTVSRAWLRCQVKDAPGLLAGVPVTAAERRGDLAQRPVQEPGREPHDHIRHLPGATLVPHATNVAGRAGIGIMWTSKTAKQVYKNEWIFDKTTLRFIGEKTYDPGTGQADRRERHHPAGLHRQGGPAALGPASSRQLMVSQVTSPRSLVSSSMTRIRPRRCARGCR